MAPGMHRPVKSRSSTGRTESHTESGRIKRPASSRNDEATIAYIKRVLCPSKSRDTKATADNATGDGTYDKPLSELLPPLTSSDELDVQLYAFVAVILENFVHSWYSRISPDQNFTSEVVQIISHCTKGLEARLCQVELIEVILDEIPALLIEHVVGELNLRHYSTT